MVQITVDKNKCIGCGACSATCPKTFGLKDGKAFVKKQPEKISCEKDAAEGCPVGAIKVK